MKSILIAVAAIALAAPALADEVPPCNRQTTDHCQQSHGQQSGTAKTAQSGSPHGKAPSAAKTTTLAPVQPAHAKDPTAPQ